MKLEDAYIKRARSLLQEKRGVVDTGIQVNGYIQLKLPNKEIYYWINHREVRMGKTFERSSDMTKWINEGIRLMY